MKTVQITKVIGVSCLVLGNGCLGSNKDQSKSSKPNLLFIITDEQQTGTLGAYGNNIIKTPNLNKLSDESFVFKNAYVTQPVSTPSRSSIMTGLYPHTDGCLNNNIPLPDSVKCLTGLLNDPSYSTGYYGKWHLGDEVFSQKGFEKWESIEDIYSEFFREGKDKGTRSSYHNWLTEHGLKPDDQANNKFSRDFASKLSFNLCKPKFLEEKACEFLEQNKKSPFILYVSFLEPHMPFSGPLNNMYDPAVVKISDSFNDTFVENEPLRYKLKREQVHKSYGTTEKDFRMLIARYWGLVTQVDSSVGVILNKLRDLDLDDNTIVVFTSDHGDLMGAHQLAEKSVMYQEAVKIPLMIKIPFIKTPPRQISNQVSQIDIIPTLLDLLKSKEVHGLQGKTLIPLIRGLKTDNDYIFIEWNPSPGKEETSFKKSKLASAEDIAKAENSFTRTVISPDGWKLCLTDNDNSQLFDLQNDPYEKNNLITNPNYNDKIALLAQKIKEWQKRTSDTLKLPDIESKLMYGFK